MDIIAVPEDSPLMLDPTLEGEKILSKKSVYEPTSSQRCRQLVCSRGLAIAILVIMGLFVVLIAIIAAFARPGRILCQQTPSSKSNLSSDKTVTSDKTFVATDGHPFPWHDIRLPGSIIPDSYHTFLWPNISQSWFKGSVTVYCTVVNPTDFVVFHLKDLNITQVQVLRGEVAVKIVDQLEYKENEQYYVKLDETLASDSKITLSVEFAGTLANKLSGFYKSNYRTQNGELRELASTHFEPTDARAAFPCFDEPALKANFSMSIVREKRHIALFNMPLQKSSDYENGLIKDEFETTVKMSTYLVAFVICDFKSITAQTKQNVTVSVYAPEEQISQAQYALRTSVKILEYYNDFFGLEYPLPKQDMIAIPDFAAGAMENWGLITYRMTSILYDPTLTSASSKQWISVVIAHELAHQWFGDIVTMNWWDDLWLNEGFASFVEYLGAGFAEPDFNMDAQFLYDTFQSALYLDSFSSSHPLLVTVKDPAEINEIFDKISYDKGASLIRMLQSFLGKEKFHEGLVHYLHEHAYGNARTADLWKAMQPENGLEQGLTVAEVMDTWTLQMGYPVVTVTLDPESNQLVASQKRFLNGRQTSVNSKFNSTYNYQWYIPFTYIVSSEPSPVKLKWLTPGGAPLTIPYPGAGQWIKANIKTEGFYRVNYDEKMWQLLIQQLKKDIGIFSPEDRAGLIDDAFALARAGLLNYNILFDLLSYLKKETEYVPWKTAISAYLFIDDRMYLTDVYPQLQKYMFHLVSNALSSLGWEVQDEHLNKLLQVSVLSFAISLHDKDTINEAKRHFDGWMTNNSYIAQDQRSLVYKAGVEGGDDSAWNYVWNQYETANVPTEKNQLLKALTFSTDPRILQLFLRHSLNESKIRAQDLDAVISGIGANKVGHIFSWRFLEQNWETIYQRYGQTSFILGNIFKGVISPFNTQFDYDEVKNFFKGRDVGSGKMALEQSLETVQTHIDWLKNYEEVVTDWIIKLKQ